MRKHVSAGQWTICRPASTHKSKQDVGRQGKSRRMLLVPTAAFGRPAQDADDGSQEAIPMTTLAPEGLGRWHARLPMIRGVWRWASGAALLSAAGVRGVSGAGGGPRHGCVHVVNEALQRRDSARKGSQKSFRRRLGLHIRAQEREVAFASEKRPRSSPLPRSHGFLAASRERRYHPPATLRSTTGKPGTRGPAKTISPGGG